MMQTRELSPYQFEALHSLNHIRILSLFDTTERIECIAAFYSIYQYLSGFPKSYGCEFRLSGLHDLCHLDSLILTLE
jgi:hypothetical protein